MHSIADDRVFAALYEVKNSELNRLQNHVVRAILLFSDPDFERMKSGLTFQDNFRKAAQIVLMAS